MPAKEPFHPKARAPSIERKTKDGQRGNDGGRSTSWEAHALAPVAAVAVAGTGDVADALREPLALVRHDDGEPPRQRGDIRATTAARQLDLRSRAPRRRRAGRAGSRRRAVALARAMWGRHPGARDWGVSSDGRGQCHCRAVRPSECRVRQALRPATPARHCSCCGPRQ